MSRWLCRDRGARISAVGRGVEIAPAQDFDAVIDARGCIVLPGLINMHQHHWYTLFKGLPTATCSKTGSQIFSCRCRST